MDSKLLYGWTENTNEPPELLFEDYSEAHKGADEFCKATGESVYIYEVQKTYELVAVIEAEEGEDDCCMTEAIFHKDGKDYNRQIAEELLEVVLTVEPKQGEWIHGRLEADDAKLTDLFLPLCQCSECAIYVQYESNYCPNCGARMKVADDE